MPLKSLLISLIGLSLALICTLFILCNDPTCSANTSSDPTDDRASGRHGTHGDVVQSTRMEGKPTLTKLNDTIQGNTKEMVLEQNQRQTGNTSSSRAGSTLTSLVGTSSPNKNQGGSPRTSYQMQSSETVRNQLVSPLPNLTSTPSIESSPSPDSVPNQSMSTDESSSANVTLEKPLFYSVDQEQVAKMSPENQYAYAGIQQDYVDFYNEWKNHYPNDPGAWNEQMKKYYQEIRLQLGWREVDRIIR